MLVLSRRQNDKIVFPRLGISVEILRISGNTVRIGVNAPPEVAVYRHEIAEQYAGVAEEPAASRTVPLSHRMRNRLHKASLGMHLANKQLERGLLDEAQATLQNALAEFEILDREIAAAQDPNRLSSAQPATRRALLVEDDINESELLAGFLRMTGFKVDVASDGCDAMDYLSRHQHPDVVLLDMHMPRCDGPSTVSAIRSNPDFQNMKVFAVSGMDPSQLNVTIGPGGVDRWFSKPVNPQMLLHELNRDLSKAPAG